MPDQTKIGPNWVPGASWRPSGARRSPKSARKHPKRDPKKAQEHPWELPGAPQARPRVPKECQREPKSDPERPRERQNRVKVGYRSEKYRFWQRCSATRPCRCAEPFRPPKIARKTSQKRPKSVLEPFKRSLWSLLVAQERLGRPRRPTWMNSEALRCPQRRFP